MLDLTGLLTGPVALIRWLFSLDCASRRNVNGWGQIRFFKLLKTKWPVSWQVLNYYVSLKILQSPQCLSRLGRSGFITSGKLGAEQPPVQQLEDFWSRLLMRLTSALESVMKVIGMEGSLFYGSWFAPLCIRHSLGGAHLIWEVVEIWKPENYTL